MHHVRRFGKCATAFAYPSRFTRLFAALLLCGACGGVPGDANDDPLRRVATTNHAAIEDLAEHKPFPRYPARSVENGAAGVAVASILMGFDGRMERVDVLQAPDADIAEAVREALRRWVLPQDLFEDNPRGPFKAAATMVFYFLIEAGKGRVVSGPALAADLAHRLRLTVAVDDDHPRARQFDRGPRLQLPLRDVDRALDRVARLQNVRFAVRGFWRRPSFPGVLVALALGVGANSATVTLAAALLVTAPDYVRDPQRVVLAPSIRSYVEFSNVSRDAKTVDLAAVTRSDLTFGVGGEVDAVHVECVTSEYFDVFPVRPVLEGRPAMAVATGFQGRTGDVQEPRTGGRRIDLPSTGPMPSSRMSKPSSPPAKPDR